MNRCDRRKQFSRFFATLFKPDDLVEFRFIESWTKAGKRKSHVAAPSQWIRAGQVAGEYDDLVRFAGSERANIYFGVCPRPKVGDAVDEMIRTVRCLWADMDDVTVDNAWLRWRAAKIPEPSIVVSSGRGVHAYWLLDKQLTAEKELENLSCLLPRFYEEFRGDHVQNLSRVMRPPGTVNYKGARNGDRRLPCLLVHCKPKRRYRLDDFERWAAPDNAISASSKDRVSLGPSGALASGDVPADSADVALLAARLDLPSRDRSRRDFAIVCGLLRLGLSPEEIWATVAGKSKFETDGRPYFELTIANAERILSRPVSASPVADLPA